MARVPRSCGSVEAVGPWKLWPQGAVDHPCTMPQEAMGPGSCGLGELWVPRGLWALEAVGLGRCGPGTKTNCLCSVFAVPGGARPAGDPVAAGLCVAPGHAHPEGVSWRGDHPSGHMGLRRQHNTVFLLVPTEGQGEVWFGTGLPYPHHENKTPFSKGFWKRKPTREASDPRHHHVLACWGSSVGTSRGGKAPRQALPGGVGSFPCSGLLTYLRAPSSV